MLYPVILSGGIGKRLWPVSNQNNPKQFQRLFNNHTLLQNTYQRVLKGFDKQNIFVVSHASSLENIKSQIDINENNILLEAEAKGTAMAIGLAAARIKSIDSEASIVIVNSDHVIKDEDNYIDLLKKAEKLLEGQYTNKFILAGVRPTYPETGYGYIKLGEEINKGIYKVDSFKEKPNKVTAEQYIENGYLWNPAIFLFKAKQLLDWYKKYLPQIYKALENIDNIDKEYKNIDEISIDHGLLEKLDDMLVLPTDIKWADIGHWRSLRDILSNGQEKNVSNTNNLVTIDSKNNLLYSSNNKKLIATVGVEDMILVETDDVIFLCPADRSQDIKSLLEKIKKEKLDKYL